MSATVPKPTELQEVAQTFEAILADYSENSTRYVEKGTAIQAMCLLLVAKRLEELNERQKQTNDLFDSFLEGMIPDPDDDEPTWVKDMKKRGHVGRGGV